MPKLSLYTDGGSRGNPGPAAFGFVIKNQTGVVLKKTGKYLGKLTNNQAEYHGLIEGLKAVLKFNPTELRCFLDSELIVKQMQGNYKVKNQGLRKLFASAQDNAIKFKKIEFVHIPREKNKEADKLLNQALDLIK